MSKALEWLLGKETMILQLYEKDDARYKKLMRETNKEYKAMRAKENKKNRKLSTHDDGTFRWKFNTEEKADKKKFNLNDFEAARAALPSLFKGLSTSKDWVGLRNKTNTKVRGGQDAKKFVPKDEPKAACVMVVEHEDRYEYFVGEKVDLTPPSTEDEGDDASDAGDNSSTQDDERDESSRQQASRRKRARGDGASKKKTSKKRLKLDTNDDEDDDTRGAHVSEKHTGPQEEHARNTCRTCKYSPHDGQEHSRTRSEHKKNTRMPSNTQEHVRNMCTAHAPCAYHVWCL